MIVIENYLQDNEAIILFLGMVGVLVLAAGLEILFPRRPEASNATQRWANNIGLTIINQVNINWVSSFVVVVLAWWGEEQSIGLLRHTDIGFLSQLMIAILAFEFVSYWFHRALHAVPWLWRIHAVHHSDTELDFTTTYRNHPLELYINVPLTVPVILMLGFPVAVVICYQLLKTSISIIAHSNIRLPEAIDQYLKLIIVTPDYHRLHHCSDNKHTDSNYCAAFPLFDYLFGTVSHRPYADHKTMELGLSYLRSPLDGRLDRLLLMPFVWKGWRRKSASAQPESA